jgi:predicted choloylglycine hydrolase
MQSTSISYRLITRCLLIFLFQAIIFPLANKISAQQLPETRVFPVIELTGDGYNRGLQHGTKLKKEITEVFAKWKANIRKNTMGDPDSMLTAFRTATNFEPIIKKYTPAVLDELKGIAAGSGQSYEDVYAFQLVDEFWIYLDKQAHTTNHHCSGMGVPATVNHPAYIAQNMDLENYMHGYQVLLHLPPTTTEPEQYIVTCAGLVALGGMNGKGVGLCLNTLMELKASEDGLPVAFIIRAVLNKQDGKEAMQFLKTVKHASGQNYIMGIGDSVYNFEASSTQVVRYLPKAGESSIVYHTNHALVNHDVKEWYKKYHEQVLAGETKNRNSEARFASLEERLNIQPVDISTDVIKTTLRSKDNARNPVCRTYREGGGGFTFSSIVFTLGGKRSVQLTYGSPDQSEYKEYFFKAVK